jgi:hypothetical protein
MTVPGYEVGGLAEEAQRRCCLGYNAPPVFCNASSILNQEPNESKEPGQNGDLPFWRVVMSVIQASFGVQNKDNRERDFKQGKALPFVVAALLFTATFVLVLMLVVKLVLSAG